MKKIIFINLDLLKVEFDEEDYVNVDWNNFDYDRLRKEHKKFIDKFLDISKQDENQIIFYSRNVYLIKQAENIFKGDCYYNIKIRKRDTVKDFVLNNRNHNNYFVFVGGKNKDFELAVNSGSLFIVPTWIPLEDRSQIYGVHVDTVKQLKKFIQTLNNQNTWYSVLDVDTKTKCYSLMDARYGYYAHSYEEKEMLIHFEKLLKQGESRNYYQILMYHFLAGMTNSMEFDDIELFGMIPSSDCTLNKDLFEFMTQVRCLKKKQLPKRYSKEIPIEDTNLFIRHTIKQKAHGRDLWERADLGGNDEFSTLHINSDYKKRIEKLKSENRFNVCIFDDYMTHGNTFNAIRNLLESLGANKIICVSLGLFRKPFQKKSYTIRGSVYGKDYSFLLEEQTILNNFDINEEAKQEVSDLYDIFNS